MIPDYMNGRVPRNDARGLALGRPSKSLRSRRMQWECSLLEINHATQGPRRPCNIQSHCRVDP